MVGPPILFVFMGLLPLSFSSINLGSEHWNCALLPSAASSASTGLRKALALLCASLSILRLLLQTLHFRG
jgi:hypothetical protein